MSETHQCSLKQAMRESEWRIIGVLRQREIERVFICSQCGRVREGRFRKIVRIEKEAAFNSEMLPDPALRHCARVIASLAHGREQLRAATVAKRLGGATADSLLERLCAFGFLRLVYLPKHGTAHLHEVCILNSASIHDFGHPGDTERRSNALQAARASVANLVHPSAVEIREILASDDARTLDPKVVTSLAGLAKLVESGDALPHRVFSAMTLNDSKAFMQTRRRVERLVGPVDRLGIRDSGAMVMFGGRGLIELSNTKIDVGSFRSIAMSTKDVERLRCLHLPEGGILVIENLTPFEACLENTTALAPMLLVWSGGFPNRGVVRILEQAARQRARIRVWCDLDLGGVRIARSIHRITSGMAEPVLMNADTVRLASVGCPLSSQAKRMMGRDLALHPDDILVDTLRSLLQRGEWIEQETLLQELPRACESLLSTSPPT
jgi:hypothetical protein